MFFYVSLCTFSCYSSYLLGIPDKKCWHFYVFFMYFHVFFMFCRIPQFAHPRREVIRIHNFSCFLMHFFMFFVNSQLVSWCSEVRRYTNRGIVFLVVSLLAGLKTLKFCIFLQFLNAVLLIGNLQTGHFLASPCMVLLLGNLKNMISYEILQFFECGPAIGEFKNWTLFGIPLWGPAIREFEKTRFPMIFHDFSPPHKGVGKE